MEWINHLFYGPLLLTFAILYRIFLPKTINDLYGYRTSRSMRSQEAWDYANKLSANMFLISGLILLLLQIIIYSRTSRENCHIITAIAMVTLVILNCALVEFQLRKNFNKEGERKS